jgi:hypothetical protein
MANYFFYDVDGVRQGPLTEQRLQVLADRGVITPNTPLETDGGVSGFAGQIPGLVFPTQTASSPRAPRHTAYSHEENSTGLFVSWLFDFAFRDLRFQIINLWACKILYVLAWIGSILWGLGMTFMIFVENIGQYGNVGVIVIGIPLLWICVVLIIIAARLACEWYIILVDWIVETTKAARLYTEKEE